MEQTVTIDIPRDWIEGVPEEKYILQHVFRLGVYQYQLERAIQLYQDGVASVGHIAEQLKIAKQDLIREFRVRGIEPDFSETTLKEELGQ